MSPSRYYTYNQFFLTLGLLACLIGIILVMGSYFFRLRKGQHNKPLVVIGVVLLGMVSGQFAYVVIPDGVFREVMRALVHLGHIGIRVGLCLFCLVQFYQGKERKFYVTVVALLVVPYLLYEMLRVYHWAGVPYIEVLLYIECMVLLHGVLHRNSPFGISFSTFEKIVNSMKTYVLVTDLHGEVVYRNKRVLEVDFFKPLHKVYVHQPQELFTQVSVEQASDGSTYIQIMHRGEPLYLSCVQRDLVVDGRPVGHLITLADITQVVDLLHQLEVKKAESEALYKKLENYSKVVYSFEKEKTIHKLLHQIIQTQSESMEKLRAHIHSLQGLVGQASFQETMEQTMQVHEEILQDIRTTVALYKNTHMQQGGVL